MSVTFTITMMSPGFIRFGPILSVRAASARLDRGSFMKQPIILSDTTSYQVLVHVEVEPRASLLAALDGELGPLEMGHTAGAIMEEDCVIRRDSAVNETFGDV